MVEYGGWLQGKWLVRKREVVEVEEGNNEIRKTKSSTPAQ
jgi:hypothetical protein